MPNGVIAHDPKGKFDFDKLRAEAAAWGGLEGLDLAKDVTTRQTYQVEETRWRWPAGVEAVTKPRFTVAVFDYGVKRNILRALGDIGARCVVLPADATAEDALAHRPDGVLLSNGPGDPAATGAYAAPEIRKLIEAGVPVMGVCLGHQMLGLALGAKTKKMAQGHHGANHPVKDLATGKVEIVSMNHGFAVDSATLPDGVKETHVSLFDGSNCGIEIDGKPVFSVQYHPEASPGPQDSHYLFERFAAAMDKRKAG
jgi:carbamoyl-phosphate synthase small subunit